MLCISVHHKCKTIL